MRVSQILIWRKPKAVLEVSFRGEHVPPEQLKDVSVELDELECMGPSFLFVGTEYAWIGMPAKDIRQLPR